MIAVTCGLGIRSAMNVKLIGPVAVSLALVAALFFYQEKAVRCSRGEIIELRARAAEAQAWRDEAARLAKSQVDPDQAERSRAAQSELLRLRSEVSRLRRQLNEQKLASAKSASL